MFTNEIYNYWAGNISYLWSIRGVSLSDDLLNILDQRARKLLLICQELNNNPSIPLPADRFDFVPVSYEEMEVVAYLLTQYTPANVQMGERFIVYSP